MEIAGAWSLAALKAEFTGRDGRVRLMLAAGVMIALLASIAAGFLLEGHAESRSVRVLMATGQAFGVAFGLKLRPQPAKWWLVVGFGAGLASSLLALTR